MSRPFGANSVYDHQGSRGGSRSNSGGDRGMSRGGSRGGDRGRGGGGGTIGRGGAGRGNSNQSGRGRGGSNPKSAPVLKVLAPPFTDDQLLHCIDVPKLREGDQLANAKNADPSVTARLYRPNVGVHFFNEYGQVLGCFRKDKKSWQTVQGGVEDIDVSKVEPRAVKVNGPHDPNILSAALREIAEEIGFEDLSSVGGEYVSELHPPTRLELEKVLNKKGLPKKNDSNESACEADISLTAALEMQLGLLEKDPSRFFKYEFPPMMGMKARSRGYVGQYQRHLLFFLPSDSIHKVNLIPDRAKYGPDVTQEFKAVAWMSPNQFVALCAPFRQFTMAYLLSSDYFRATVESFMSAEGRGGIKALPPVVAGEEAVKQIAPHVTDRIVAPPKKDGKKKEAKKKDVKKKDAERRPRSPDDEEAGRDDKSAGMKSPSSSL